MARAISIRRDYSPEELIARAALIKDQGHARRLMAMAAILTGASREEAAKVGGMERQTLRDWVQRFNEHGPDGLSRRKSPGRPPKLTEGQRKALTAHLQVAIKSGGASDWRLSDVAGFVSEHFGVELDEVSVSRILREHGFRYNGSEWTVPDARRHIHISALITVSGGMDSLMG
jgi:transposase